MVCLDRLREMVYFLKKNISLSCIHTQRNSRFDFSFNGLTYMLCAPQISLELTGGNRDGHWGNLQFVLWRIPLRRGREMGERGEKYTSEKELAWRRPPWKNTDISCTETPLCTSKTQTVKKQGWVEGTRVTWNRWNSERRGGGGVLLWDKWAVFFNIHQSSVHFEVNMDGVGTDWQTISLTHINIQLNNILTSPAVPHGHFAHPGLSDGGTRYCVLGWFLYNVPRPGLQTPLIATGFVSPGAGSPFAPLAHLTALCRDTQEQWCAVKPRQIAI